MDCMTTRFSVNVVHSHNKFTRIERLSSSRRGFIVTSGISFAAASIGLVVAGTAVAAVMNSNSNRQAAFEATRKGMNLFAQGRVEDSLVEFDKVLTLDPSQRPYLWQRGLTLYYLDKFEEGAKQFREDVAVNPNDTEESIWAFLCESQLTNAGIARKNFLQVGRDPRPVMRAAYELFKTGEGLQELEKAASRDPDGHDSFYALLYIGLFHESNRDVGKAREAILSAVSTTYGTRSGDYMAKLAAVHCKVRGWS